MTRFIPSLLCFVLCAICIRLAVENIHRFSRPPDAVFEGPGVFCFEAPAADEFTIWHLISVSADGEFVVRDADLPVGTRIKITSQGQTIPTTADTSTTTTSSQGQRKSVLTFTAQTISEYRIEVSGFVDKRSFAITHGPIVKPLLIAIAWIGAAVMLGLATVVFIVLAVTNAFPKKPQNAPMSKAAALTPPAGQEHDTVR